MLWVLSLILKKWDSCIKRFARVWTLIKMGRFLSYLLLLKFLSILHDFPYIFDVSSIGDCRPRIFFINGFLCFLEDEW